jgi:rhodanese-related sulfurtransferase
VRLFTRTPSIDAAGAAELLAARTAVVVDVRQPAEWRAGHINGALHIPLSQLSRRLAELPRDKTIVTVCRSGHRSGIAARTLTRADHEVLNLKGGINAWARAGLPLGSTNKRKR